MTDIKTIPSVSVTYAANGSHINAMLNDDATATSHYTNLIEGLFFSPSHLSPGIQLADMVAGATHKKIKGNGVFFDKIRPNFRTNNTGKIEGFGVVK